MKKQQVKSINNVIKAYVHVDSKFGSDKNTVHPYHKRYSIKAVCKLTEGVKDGDIVRCDGIPYKAKPKSIYDVETRQFFRAAKLESGLWVLRQ